MFHLFGFPFFAVSVALYFLPTIIAASRKKTNLVGIFLVNFLLGWSVIGWVVALIWAVSIERVDQVQPPPQGWSTPPSPPPPPRGRFCPSCGSQATGSHFCANCGAALS